MKIFFIHLSAYVRDNFFFLFLLLFFPFITNQRRYMKNVHTKVLYFHIIKMSSVMWCLTLVMVIWFHFSSFLVTHMFWVSVWLVHWMRFFSPQVWLFNQKNLDYAPIVKSCVMKILVIFLRNFKELNSVKTEQIN